MQLGKGNKTSAAKELRAGCFICALKHGVVAGESSAAVEQADDEESRAE